MKIHFKTWLDPTYWLNLYISSIGLTFNIDYRKEFLLSKRGEDNGNLNFGHSKWSEIFHQTKCFPSTTISSLLLANPFVGQLSAVWLWKTLKNSIGRRDGKCVDKAICSSQIDNSSALHNCGWAWHDFTDYRLGKYGSFKAISIACPTHGQLEIPKGPGALEYPETKMINRVASCAAPRSDSLWSCGFATGRPPRLRFSK